MVPKRTRKIKNNLKRILAHEVVLLCTVDHCAPQIQWFCWLCQTNLAIILQKSNGLQNEKTGNIVISEKVSGDVPKTGLEPAPSCLE